MKGLGRRKRDAAIERISFAGACSVRAQRSRRIVRRLSAGEARDLASATKKAKERRQRKRRNNNEKRIARRENGLGSLSARPMKR